MNLSLKKIKTRYSGYPYGNNILCQFYVGLCGDPISDASGQNEPLPRTRRVHVILDIFVGDEEHPDLELEKLFPKGELRRLQRDEICRHQLQLAISFVLIWKSKKKTLKLIWVVFLYWKYVLRVYRCSSTLKMVLGWVTMTSPQISNWLWPHSGSIRPEKARAALVLTWIKRTCR